MMFLSFRCLLFLVFSTALILAVTNTANACSCGPRPTVLESFEEADEVVIARVVSVEKALETEAEHYVDGIKSTTMVVEKVFKGKLKVRDEIVFGQGGGADCIWTFNEEEVGDQLLLYLDRPEKHATDVYLTRNRAGLWLVFNCGRSRGVDGATEDLLYLENLSKRRGKTRISGRIGNHFAFPDIDIEGKKIKIIGPKKTYQTKTDEDGVFEIYDLPPGKYFIEPEVPAGWKIAPYWLRYSPSVVGAEIGEPEMKSPKQFAVMLEPKKHASVEIVITVDNSVRGRVLDSAGRAMYGVCVSLLKAEENAEGGGGFDCTDEHGRFEISEVPEGKFVLVANHDGKPSNREPFPTIFYPSVMERERATVISIGPGERVDLDLIIPKLEETITISGVLLYSDGKPAVEKWVRFKVTTPNEKVEGDVSEQTDKAGRFTMTILKGVTGELAGEEWLLKGLYKNCPKADELIAKSGESSVTAYSNVIKLTTEQNMYEVELTMPFPQCERVKE